MILKQDMTLIIFSNKVKFLISNFGNSCPKDIRPFVLFYVLYRNQPVFPIFSIHDYPGFIPDYAIGCK